MVGARTPRDALIEWRRGQGVDGELPRGADVGAFSTPRLARHLLVLDVVSNPVRFRVRLVGSDIVALIGEDWTGCWVDHRHLGPLGVHVAGALATTVGKHGPTAGANTIHRPKRPCIAYEAVRLPLRGPGSTVEQIVSCLEAA
ncbi:hypothetical protein SAMN05216241_10913 [Limimonas halophila]|uniref:PAS domain-containing protein n=2 Tax=Limimonas halophila TaxID=1082479 RepID=A0A1G7TC38_9PROT|nr:hypothetical protein SAMN05216241_10913 [Limimonas halophila]